MQVLIGVALGVLVGSVWPKPGEMLWGRSWPTALEAFKPLGDAFAKRDLLQVLK